MNLYFSGIGGIGISALAQYCLTQGHTVTGSEISANPITEKLQSLGVVIHFEQKAENITNPEIRNTNPESQIDLLIYTEAVPPTNPERQKADELGILQKSYFEYLGEVSKSKRTIAVAGTHGKTTTVGMISSGFLAADFDVTVFIGSTLPEFHNANFHAGTNEWLLVEACEYRNNFQFLEPEIVVLTNVEYDHPDAYESEEHYLQTMTDFCDKAKVVIHHPDPISEKILQKFSGHRIPTPQHTTYDTPLSIPGQHNRENAALALTLAEYLQESLPPSSLFPLSSFQKGLSSFSGTGRRQEYLGIKNDLHIYDDYGHHPTEIRVTIQALREKYPKAQIGLIYEPHQYSRTRQFKDEFIEAFQSADFLGLYPIYEARDTEQDKASISRNDLLSPSQGELEGVIDTLQDVQNFCQKLAPGDVLIFMGAGKISQFAREFMEQS